MILHLAQTVRCTEAEGPGRRFAIWFQGCPLRCPGCCNPEMLPFEGGEQIELQTLLSDIEAAASEDGVEGITLMGGEPFAHADAASELSREVRQRGLSVMIFTGYTLEELRDRHEPAVDRLLSETDLLVDGPYRRELPENGRRWIGSSNQRIHFLTDRYDQADPCWREPNTLEVRIENGEVSINGFPAQNAVGLWKRMS